MQRELLFSLHSLYSLHSLCSSSSSSHFSSFLIPFLSLPRPFRVQVRDGSPEADITLFAIFEDNSELSRHVTKQTIDSYVLAMSTNGTRKISHLNVFRALIKPNGQIQSHAQTMIMDALLSLPDDFLQLYADGNGFKRLVRLMGAAAPEDVDTSNPYSTSELAFHIELVRLLSICTEGFNVNTEIRCQSLLPLEELSKVCAGCACLCV